MKAVDLQNYHSPGLRELQDVVVFSVRGDRSLASLLSGGDYDGDKVRIFHFLFRGLQAALDQPLTADIQ